MDGHEEQFIFKFNANGNQKVKQTQVVFDSKSPEIPVSTYSDMTSGQHNCHHILFGHSANGTDFNETDLQRRRFTRLKRPSEGNSDSDDNLFVPVSTMSTVYPDIQSTSINPIMSNGLESIDAFETVALNSDIDNYDNKDEYEIVNMNNGLDINKFQYNSYSNSNSCMVLKFKPEVDLTNNDIDHRPRTSSIVDGLLFEIYDKLNFGRRYSADSDTYTESSMGGGPKTTMHGRRHSSSSTGVSKVHYGRLQRKILEKTDEAKLRALIRRSQITINQVAAELIQQLKRRDRLLTRRDRNYDVITAVLQAASLKRRVDTRMRFSVEPFVGDSGFAQWHDAMRMVARLPGGIPWEFRKRLWLTMAEKHIQHRKVDWERVKRFCFNDRSNPDDNELGVQIVKDLHRTGCSLFCGVNAEHNQALLKRVLLAYARWNKTVGYCQGFNMLAALILEVMEWKEEDALKVMIYLIEGVLPESYFANNLRGLSVDMAVFRDLLRMRLTSLSRHLDHLQLEARDTVSGTSYEPPLTNVFTMQWFLTLFSNCLPKATVLRVWDLIFLEGNEVLLRTALTIWDGLADRIMAVDSADEFYSIMGVLTREMLEFGLMDANNLVKTICTMAPFPFPQLSELRDKYTYNITPFTAAAVGVAKRGLRLFYSDDEEEQNEDEQLAVAAWCFASVFPPQLSPIKAKGEGIRSPSPSSASNGTNFTSIGPGAYGTSTVHFPDPNVGRHLADADRMSLDISALKKQYAKLRERQKQAHVILAAASSRQQAAAAAGLAGNEKRPQIAVNHLLIGKKALVSRRNSHGSLHGLIRFQFKSNGSASTTKTTKSIPLVCKGSTAQKDKTKDPKKPVSHTPVTSSASHSHISESNQTTSGQHRDRKNSLPTPESGETLHWKDAKRCVLKQQGSESTELKPVKKGKSSKTEKLEEDDKLDKSSTSTELCDEDVGRVSDLDSDLDDADEKGVSHRPSSTTTDTVTATASDTTESPTKPLSPTETIGDCKQLSSLTESSDGQITSILSRATCVDLSNIPSVVISPDDWPKLPLSESYDSYSVPSKTPSPSKELSESDAESEPGINVSRWIDSFDRGLLDSDDYQVLEIEGEEAIGIVELSEAKERQMSADDDDYMCAEKRGEWLAKLEMYRRTLGMDTIVTECRTSSDEYHSFSDSTATCEDDDNDVECVPPTTNHVVRPNSLQNISTQIEVEEVSPSPTYSSLSSKPYADNEKVKRYFDQGSPIRNVPTAYVPGRTKSIHTDMDVLGQTSVETFHTTSNVSSRRGHVPAKSSPSSPTKSSGIFNPFPTARKSQIWGNNEIGVKLGLYGNQSNVSSTTKKQLGQR